MPLKYAKKRIGKAPKQKQVEKLLGALKAADSVVVADLHTLKVADLSKLRTDLRQKGARLIVARNTLVQIALKEAGYPSLDPLLKGPTALAFGVGDPAVPARVLLDLLKENETLKIKGGVVEGEVLDVKGVEMLSKMPGRTELLGRLVGSLNAPVQKLVFALHQTQGKIVYALDAYKRKLEQAEGGGAA